MELYYIVECEYQADYTHEEKVICVSDDLDDLVQKRDELNQRVKEKKDEYLCVSYDVKQVVKPRSDIWSEDFDVISVRLWTLHALRRM
jgi:hypothetical protein